MKRKLFGIVKKNFIRLLQTGREISIFSSNVAKLVKIKNNNNGTEFLKTVRSVFCFVISYRILFDYYHYYVLLIYIYYYHWSSWRGFFNPKEKKRNNPIKVLYRVRSKSVENQSDSIRINLSSDWSKSKYQSKLFRSRINSFGFTNIEVTE